MSTQHPVSVILCTHNPRMDYLIRVLTALRSQTLPHECWELVVIDNASREKLADIVDLSWHPNGRHVREEKLGLTNARLRGIAETISDVLVFVDDDNVLAPEYLSVALEVAGQWPILGTWGGQSFPEFEVQPEPHVKPYLSDLFIRTLDRDAWSNFPRWCESHPRGAGMCVRRAVAKQYSGKVVADPRRRMLGRRGADLSSCEDADINRRSCEIGLGCGVFQALRLTHLIPSGRLREDYLRRLWRSLAFSDAMLRILEGEKTDDTLELFAGVVWNFCKAVLRRQTWVGVKFSWARLRGTQAAVRFVQRDGHLDALSSSVSSPRT